MVEQDNDSTRAICGRDRAFRTILSGGVAPPKSALHFMKAVAFLGRLGAVCRVKCGLSLLCRRAAPPGLVPVPLMRY